MDLHTNQHPLTVPSGGSKDEVQVSPQSPSRPAAHAKLKLTLSPNVREHLMAVFFDFIQPVLPVVTRESLVQYPATPFLDAVIMGLAARHHLAIASWRDFAHTQEVIRGEILELFCLRTRYSPSIQTLQALLLMSLRLELCARSHKDFQQMSFRVSFACKMAQDLQCNITREEGNAPDAQLRQTLWAACLLQDAQLSAALGQTMNLSSQHDLDFSLNSLDSAPHVPYRFFFTSVTFASCLRMVLRTVYSVLPCTGGLLYERSMETLNQIQLYQSYIDAQRHEFEEHEYRCLQMMHWTTRLLFVQGLRLTVGATDPFRKELQQLIGSQGSSLLIHSCSTLEWSTPELIRSIPGQLQATLYCTSRALMVVVDVLRDSKNEMAYSASVSRRLWRALACARSFMGFLDTDESWGKHWTQAHTLRAILARLDQNEMEAVMTQTRQGDASPHSPQNTEDDNDQMADSAAVADTAEDAGLGWFGDELELSNLILDPTEWERFFEEYDQMMYS